MKIRYANPSDAAMLAMLGAKTFREAYGEQIETKEMEAYMAEFFSAASQATELSDPNSIFLVAETDGTPIGYAKLIINSHHEAVTGQTPMEIGRIYFVQQHTGMGLGSKLIKRCISEAKERGCDTIWLGVWENNEKAIAFYQKWKFKEVGAQSFQLGRELQRDLIMELPFGRIDTVE